MNKKGKLLLLLSLSIIFQASIKVSGKDDYPKAEINETQAVLSNSMVKLEIHKINGSFCKALLFPDPKKGRALTELELRPAVLLRIGSSFKWIMINLTEVARVGCNCPGADVAGLVLAGYIFIGDKRLDANYLIILRKNSEFFEVRFSLRGNGEFEVGFVSFLTVNVNDQRLLVPGLHSPPPPSITAIKKLTLPTLILKGANGTLAIAWSPAKAGPIQPYFNYTFKGLIAGLAAPSAPEWIEEDLKKCVVSVKKPYHLKPYPLYDSKLKINFKLLVFKTDSLATVLEKMNISISLLSRNFDIEKSLKELGEAYVEILTRKSMPGWVEETAELVKALYGYISYTGKLELEQKLRTYVGKHLETLSDPIIAAILAFPEGSLRLISEKISRSLTSEKPEYARYLIEAYMVLGNRTLLKVAKRIIDKNGVFNLATAEAALALYRVTDEEQYLKLAKEWAAVNLLNTSPVTGLYMVNAVADLEKSQGLAKILAEIAVLTKDEFWTNSSLLMIAGILNVTGNRVLVTNFLPYGEHSQLKNITTLNLLVALEILACSYPYLQLSQTVFLKNPIYISAYGEITRIVVNSQRIDLLVKGGSLKTIILRMIPKPAGLALNSSSLQNDSVSYKYIDKASILVATVKIKGTANITLFFHETPSIKASTFIDSKEEFATVYLEVTNNGRWPVAININVMITGEGRTRTLTKEVSLYPGEHKVIQLVEMRSGIYKLFVKMYADGLLVYEDALNISVPEKQKMWSILVITLLLALLMAAGILLKHRKDLFQVPFVI